MDGVECPWCGGMVYRFHELIDRPFKCVRCERKLSDHEILNPWVHQFIKRNRDINDQEEINKLLKELL